MDIKRIIESLSPNERKILPYLEEKNINEICKKSNLDKVSVLRSLEYLQNKNIVKLETEKQKIVELSVNGALYKKRGLPERRLLSLLNEKRILLLQEAQKDSGLSDDEFKASLGALKRKALVELKNGKIILNANREEIAKKSLEEIFLEALPLPYDSLTPEQLFALKSLQTRKNILEIKEEKNTQIEKTDLWKKIMNSNLKSEDFVEQITPEILRNEKLWKGKKFRRYDVTSKVPEISGGKTHFVNQAVGYARKIWTEMGFKEMNGNIVVNSFWNFDALFTAQDHPVREMQDTFFLDLESELPDKKLVEAVRKSHETGTPGSRGWQYNWDEEEAKKMLVRTHTTCLSSQTLGRLKPEDIPAKYFAIGKCFRNETVDWSHGFEFNQTEGIVVDPDANFRHLLGYLKQFLSKMGFEKIKFVPAYFPYTEPSVEIHTWHPERKIWIEFGGAGIFRPEVTIPLLGKHIPILAWGQGMDRMIMDHYEIKDLRELYKNNLTQLRKMKYWIK